jgi:hypothetical protein
MERRGRRAAERLEGRGPLSRDGANLGKVYYRAIVYRKFVIVREGHEAARTPDWDVQVSGPQLNMLALWPARAILTLGLEDGRQVQGFLRGNRLVLSDYDQEQDRCA